MDCISDILVIKNVRNELTATVRLVTCRESTTEHKDMTLIDILLHFCDRAENIVLCKVAEHTHTDLSTGSSPSLGRIVIAVCTREYREICDRFLHWLALIFKIRLLSLEWLDTLKTGRSDCLIVSLCSIWIYLGKLRRVGSHKVEDVELLAVDSELALFSICHLTDEDCIRIVEFALSLNENRTITVVEEFSLIVLDARIETVTE